MKTDECWAEYLRRRGIRFAFAAAGRAGLWGAALGRVEIRLVEFSRVGTALGAASALGQLTGLPSVCLVDWSNDLTDLRASLAAASRDQAPLLVFELPRPHVHPSCQPSTPLASAAKHAGSLLASRLIADLTRAWNLAYAEPSGPVYVALPLPDEQVGEDRDVSDDGYTAAETPGPAPSEPEIVARRIDASRRPVLVVGLGVRQLDWSRELVVLAEALGGPVLVTLQAKSYFPERHRLFAGMIGPNAQTPAEIGEWLVQLSANRAGDPWIYRQVEAGEPNATIRPLFSDTDLIVGVGLGADDWRWLRTIGVPVVGLAAGAIPAAAEGCLCLSIEDQGVLAGFRARLAARASWVADGAVVLGGLGAGVGGDLAGELSSPRPLFGRVLDELRARLPACAIVVADAGTNALTLARSWPAGWPGTYLDASHPTGALPGAIAAWLACPDRRIVALVAGESLTGVSQELGVLVRLDAGVLIVAGAPSCEAARYAEAAKSVGIPLLSLSDGATAGQVSETVKMAVGLPGPGLLMLETGDAQAFASRPRVR